jgi:hypothetical protein
MAANAAGGTTGKFRMSQVVLQWSLGMMVSTPLIAIFQGTYLLSDYRVHHGDAPRPIMPARGVAVAVKTEAGNPNNNNNASTLTLNPQQPLRLLVVGDSLAAGVGMSKSGTPVLPESIARALSKACGGRAVYWTCVGTPGVSASQIVQDIHQIRKSHEPGRLERLFKEWQAKRRKWQQRQELRRRLTELESKEGGEFETETPIRNYLKDWWELLRNKEGLKTPAHIREATQRMVQEWWKQVTTRVQATKERVTEDLTEIKDIVQSSEEEEEKEEETKQQELIQKGNMFRRDSVDPQVVAEEYDVAVVLTGLNDLKVAFMPHMNMGGQSSAKEGTEEIVGGLRNQLGSVLQALRERMDLESEKKETTDTIEVPTEPSSTAQTTMLQTLRRPLVVVPELPVAPLQLFRLVPLSWFLVPLFRAMENNKKFLSACFPDYVVFIPQPDLNWWSDVEAGLGPIRENLRQERLLLRRTDVAKSVRDRIQELMKEHYNEGEVTEEEKKELTQASSSDDNNKNHQDDHHPHHPHHHSDHHVVSANNIKESKDKGRSPYVAVDKMHPNDEGYELWGRHIAAAIVQHWDR